MSSRLSYWKSENQLLKINYWKSTTENQDSAVKYMGYGVYVDDCVCVLPDLTWLPHLGVGRKSWYIIILYHLKKNCIRNFNHIICEVLSYASQKFSSNKIAWTADVIECFRCAVDYITKYVPLYIADRNGKFVIQTDTSYVGLGAILFRRMDHEDRPI